MWKQVEPCATCATERLRVGNSSLGRAGKMHAYDLQHTSDEHLVNIRAELGKCL
jgi:hypothetical protein